MISITSSSDYTAPGGVLPLEFDLRRAAVIGIDLHRGHLDAKIATMPLPPETAARVVTANRRLFQLAREHRVPVIHLVLGCRELPGVGRENLAQPFKSGLLAQKRNMLVGREGRLLDHNLVGSPQTEIMPELGPEPQDYVINYKRRMSSYYGTDLDILLRGLDVDTVLITGVNTNTCVQMASMESYCRDLRVVVVEECVNSMDGEALHNFALQNISRRLGWVIRLADIQSAISAETKAAAHSA
jgi:biuret amidohydrolase